MVPPKKDAFADLFQSANKNNPPKANKLAMSQRQTHQNNDWDILSGNSSSLAIASGANTPSVDPFDIFTSNGTGNGGNNMNSSIKNDPFDIFGGSDSNINSVNGSNAHVNDVSSFNNNNNEISLLDDDFTDAFSKVEVRNDNNGSKVSTPKVSTPSIAKFTKPATPTSAKDHIIAELVDIGFSIEDANEAVSVKGHNLQSCVNYIMSKNQDSNSNSRSNSRTNSNSNSSSQKPQVTFNGGDWLNKGVSLFNQTKNTVMKNLDQFVEGQISQPGNTSPVKDDRPAWMKSADKYKDQATERKFGGEDYGSDSENINHEEISRFMQQTKEKDRERNKQRLQSMKQAVLTPSSSNRASPKINATNFEKPPSSSNRASPNINNTFEKPPSRMSTPNERSQSSTPKNTSSAKSAAPAIPKPTPIASPKSVEAEVDLLGMSSNLKSSSMRDNVPLNQFDQTDYTLSNNKAQQSFKSGDYATALESYLICLGKLSNNHELRVVINSNLANVYKLVGQLKNALQSIDEALGLITEDEINDASYQISDKSIKYWYTKLIICKAEVLEHSEKYEDSLANYSILIQKLGVVDRKITDGRRRVDKIVNPENYKPKPAAKPKVVAPTPTRPTKTKPLQTEELDGLQKEKIDIKIQQWVDQKQDNLRSLLVELNDIIPAKISMSDKLRHLTGNELMLPKQVKINYMKVISSIHPDKLASQCKDDKVTELVCKSVFIKLNQSWEQFKSQENV